ncbi:MULTISPECIES: ferritin-like protein [unclassified Chromobacterium]|uniref:ferritin-like domain-containing protein n=1 Tax=unclassified Chromobacterium TaxID=2641838 RepID=UPI0006530375|nr:ferritin-like protein [Chromobacterium sp. LK1]KMN37707.1 hypothetical protein VI26_01885 [Chromobacterium sp. LK1]
MIRLQRSIIHGIRAAKTAADLHYYLQNAVELEHATIPPYLTAMFSLKAGYNEEIRQLIHSIVMQEMLHMCIAGNILISIGGHPQINKPPFIPKYPGPLPMSIGGEGFIVGIEPFSKELVFNTFMVIEEPEDPVPVETPKLAAEDEPDYATIGEFYDAIKKKIKELGDGIFIPATVPKQVLGWFSPERLFPITDVASALHAINIIIVEGEGTSTNPNQSPGNPAHYYKFGEIYYGRRIVSTPDGGYAYAGAPVPYDEDGVYPMVSNPQDYDYQDNTQAKVRVEAFAYSYSSLLNALHQAFNGEPKRIDTAIGLMYDLKVQAVSLMETPVAPGSEQTAGPSYRYVNTQGGMDTSD